MRFDENSPLSYDSGLRMRFALSSSRYCTGLAAMLMVALGFASAHAGGHGEMIQFSDPSGPAVSASNTTSDLNSALERLNPTPSGFKQAQMDLFGPLKNSMRPPDSMQGVMAVPMTQSQPAPDKRTREMMDRRRNWAFTDLSDLNPGPNMEEMFGVKEYGTDGKEKKDLSAMEKYYDNLNRKSGLNQKTGGEFNNAMLSGLNPYTGTFAPANSLTPVISAFPNGEPAAMNAFATARGTDTSEKSSDIFKGNEPTPESIEETMASQKRLDEFKRLLDSSLPPAMVPHVAGTGINLIDFTRRASPYQSGQNNNDPFKAVLKQEPHRSALNPALGVIDPTTAALHSHVYDDPTAAALGMPNPLKPTAPSKPAETVKQMLDPFAASIMKPKF